MRINKYLASAEIGSRRKVEEYILEQKEKENALSKKKEDAKKVQDAYQNLLDIRKKYYEDIYKLR